MSLIFPFIGSKFGIWYLDPLGAAILSLYVVYDWANTAFSAIVRLTGAAVSPQMAKKLIYLAWRFSPVIDAYKSMTAYHVGDGIVVELEVALDEETPLAKAHDISQTMQYCFEGNRFITPFESCFGPNSLTRTGRSGSKLCDCRLQLAWTPRSCHRFGMKLSRVQKSCTP